MVQKAVFTSYSSHADAENQARRAGYIPVGATTRMQGGQTIFIVFARQGIAQRTANMGEFTRQKIWG